MKIHNWTAWVAAVVLAAACATPQDEVHDALPQRASDLFGVVQPVAGAEVPAPQAVLGRALFWDTRLSVDGKTACASCHSRDDWSAGHRPFSINAKGQSTTLQSQAMFMAQDPFALRWYGARKDGTHQAERLITGPTGYGGAKELVSALKRFDYEDIFRAAITGESETLTGAHYAKALAAYGRTTICGP